MLALTWEDLLYDQGRVNIDKSLSQVKNRNRKEGEPKNIWNLGTPKTKKGKRLASFNKKARFYMTELKRIQRYLGYEDSKHIARTPSGQPLSKSTWTSL